MGWTFLATQPATLDHAKTEPIQEHHTPGR